MEWPEYVSKPSRGVIRGLLAGRETERLGGTVDNVEKVSSNPHYQFPRGSSPLLAYYDVGCSHFGGSGRKMSIETEASTGRREFDAVWVSGKRQTELSPIKLIYQTSLLHLNDS